MSSEAPLLPGADRLPPQSRDAERSVLGSMLRDNSVIDDVIQILRDDNFYFDAHQKIFKTIVTIKDSGHPVDLVILAERLHQEKLIEDVGGYAYLSELWDAAPTAANAEYYAKIVRDKGIVRNLIHASTEILRDAYDQNQPADELLGSAEKLILDIAEKGVTGNTTTLREAITMAYSRMDARKKRGHQDVSGIPTGFVDLDHLTAGLQNSELILLAARPSVGKTAMALNFVRHIIVEEKIPVFFVSLEQARIELAERLLVSQARVDSHKLRKGALNFEEMQRLVESGSLLSGSKLFIDDTPAQSMLRISANARRLKLKENIRLVVIDYLQLIEPENRRDPRQEQVAQISRRLKFLARELEIPVIALAQVNRSAEDRQDHRPRLSDLRESGCLRGDALVTLADHGERIPIRDLVGRSNFRVWALDESNYQLTKATVSRAFCSGRKLVYRLETRLGRVIHATANHRFRTLIGWKRLDELTKAERIALPRKTPFGRQRNITSDQAALLGHLIGDGCTLPRHSIQYTTREFDLAENVTALAIAVFGSKVCPRIQRERNWYQVYLSSSERLTHGRRNPIASWLDGLGIFGLRSHEKYVPGQLFTQQSSTIARFLQHLWTTDGSIRPPEGKPRHPQIYYASSSYQLASDVQSLLLRLGINAVLRSYSQGTKGRMQFHVSVMGKEDILRFADVIGSVGAYKTTALAACRDWVAGRASNTNRDVIPRDLWKAYAIPAMQRNHIPMRSMQATMGMAFMGSGLYKQNVSRERLSRVARAVGGESTLAALAVSDVYWDEIRSITPETEEDVYDLTVPGPANFIANDIFVHNSLEQDADTVLLLHRPGKSDQSVEDNIIEVLVAKQRNGPTGEITLTYLKQYMRYDNHAIDPGFTN